MSENEEGFYKRLQLLEIFERLKLIVNFQSQTLYFLKAYTSNNLSCTEMVDLLKVLKS
jgi:hypothetical protein